MTPKTSPETTSAEPAPVFVAPALPSWRREVAALTAICEIMEPLDPATRKRAFAAVLCTMDDEAASAAIWAWQQKRKG
jgi:hypothetical protein